MKNEIVWPSAIGESKKGENTHLRRYPKPGSDSSVRSVVWPSAKVGSDEEQEMPDFGSIRKLPLIQVIGLSCDLRSFADCGKGKEMPVFSGIRRTGLIQAFGPSSGLRPLADGKKTNIYAAASDIRFGQEASVKIGLRLGEFEARSGKRE